MQYFKFALATFVFVALSSVASAADWTTTDGGSLACTSLKQDGICWQTAIAADSSAINIRTCATWTILVYGTVADIMPQSCTDKTCATAEDLLATALTGDSPNAYVTSVVPFEFVRVVYTSGTATVSIKCGR